jgi:hypothetical protein
VKYSALRRGRGRPATPEHPDARSARSRCGAEATRQQPPRVAVRAGARRRQVSRSVVIASVRRRRAQAPELALADLQHAPVERGRPARRAASAGSGSPSSFTPPCAACAAPPSASRRTRRRSAPAGARRRRRRRTTSSSMSSGSSRATKTRSKCASASAPPPRAVEAGHERARERALGVARAAPGAAAAEQQVVPLGQRASGIESVLPYISSGGSVIPMWLPRTSTSSRRRRCRSSGTSARPARAGRRRAGRAPHQQVEGLVGAAELDVGAHATES